MKNLLSLTRGIDGLEEHNSINKYCYVYKGALYLMKNFLTIYGHTYPYEGFSTLSNFIVSILRNLFISK